MSENDPSAQIDRSWNANAAAWTTTVRRGLIESRRMATDRAVVEAVLALNPARVLDVGCGEGWLCRTLAGRRVSTVGVDGSAALVLSAHVDDPNGRYFELRYADFERLPKVAGAAFDAAVFNFSLFHEKVGPTIGGVVKVVRPGGAVVVQTAHPSTGNDGYEYADGWRTETFCCMGQSFPEPMPWYFRTRESWLNVVKDAGLETHSILEPQHPQTGAPLSLLIVAKKPGA